MTAEDAAAMPQLIIDADSRGFWESLSEGEFRLCRCEDCRRWFHPAMERCRDCNGPTRYESPTGKGTLFSYITVNYPAVPAMASYIPYRIGVVEFDDQAGLRMAARIDGADATTLRIGQRMQVAVVRMPETPQAVAVFRVDG